MAFHVFPFIEGLATFDAFMRFLLTLWIDHTPMYLKVQKQVFLVVIFLVADGTVINLTLFGSMHSHVRSMHKSRNILFAAMFAYPRWLVWLVGIEMCSQMVTSVEGLFTEKALMIAGSAMHNHVAIKEES